MKKLWDKIVEVFQVVAAIILSAIVIGVLVLAITNGQIREAPFEGNLLPGWDCQTPMAITSGSLPNTVLIAYRSQKGEWVYQQFSQTGLKKDKPFFSENCPRGVPISPPAP